MKNILSAKEARTLILNSQKLLNTNNTTLSTIEHLGYIQIDTLSVIQRVHHHTLWTRNANYKTSDLDTLVKEGKVFEYWSHAASYLPMSEYRYTLPMKQAILKNEQKHWFDKDEPLMRSVLERIKGEGALMARDFEGTSKKGKDWTSKPAKKALECLFIQGELMISSRKNFHKVYDLTERVLSDNIDTSVPSREEHIRFLITKYLKVNALGQASEMCYLLKNIKKEVTKTLKEMHESKELIEVEVGDKNYYALAHLLDVKNEPLKRSSVKILSPFDNLLIQRKRMKALFDFDYLIECYVPKEKRKYGYFSLPILWEGRLVARMDCKAERKESVLHVYNIVLELSLSDMDEFALALYEELLLFVAFNDCSDFVLHKSTPFNFISILKSVAQLL